tara:strand:- start:156 stop:359 length:204 start_codon:yes stop_codon:yes gene_type:complete
VRVGSLVILNVHSHFTNGIKDVIGIPFNEVGIVLDHKCGVCTVIFPMLNSKMISLEEQDLEIISEAK